VQKVISKTVTESNCEFSMRVLGRITNNEGANHGTASKEYTMVKDSPLDNSNWLENHPLTPQFVRMV
jgi:hypothetical protein